jgi:hypothetical protein
MPVPRRRCLELDHTLGLAAAADARVVIPIQPSLRSLNVAMASAMALGEVLCGNASQIVIRNNRSLSTGCPVTPTLSA